MNHDITILRQIFQSAWKTIFVCWGYRGELLKILDELERLRADDKVTKDALHLTKLEVAHLKDRIVKLEAEHAKSRGHVGKLWQYISARSRVDVPPTPGTIREIIEKANNR